jgi:hypothetical protein
LTRRSFPAWLAIVALTLQALWPLLAQAKADGEKLLVPVCTVEGVTHYVQLAGGGSPGDRRPNAVHDHCKLCVFGADRHAAIAPLPFPPLRIAVAAHCAAAPAAALDVACHCSSSAQPRAPPTLS